MRHVTKRRVLQWKKNHEEHTEEEIVKPDQTRIKSRRSVVTSVEGQQMDERVMGNAKWPDRRRSLNGLIPRLSIASPPSPKNGDDQLVPCQPSNNGTIQVHNSNDQNDGYYEMSTVTTVSFFVFSFGQQLITWEIFQTKTVVTTQVVKRFVPNPNASPIIETIELHSPSPPASPTALATPSPRKRAKTRDESFDTGDDLCAEHDSAIGETPKMSKKNSNGRLSTSTALVLHTPHLRRNPGILIPTPKRSTKKNSDSDKVIYRRNRIKNILLDASKGSLIDKKEIIRDACQIECEQDAELRVVPRDIDQKGVEEVVERTRNDKTLDILSELGKLTPKAIYIKERKIKDWWSRECDDRNQIWKKIHEIIPFPLVKW